jgi:hypothetical protein
MSIHSVNFQIGFPETAQPLVPAEQVTVDAAAADGMVDGVGVDEGEAPQARMAWNEVEPG